MQAAQSLKIGVVGAGAMGRGIVQLFAQAGHAVWCFDTQAGAADKAVAYVDSMLAKLVDKGRLTADALAQIRTRLHAATALADLARCDVVVEAIVENLEAKRSLFRALEAVVGTQALLVSNTSSLVVADIAAACEHPQRVAGLHFFNPVPLMRVTEVVAAVRTAPAVVQALVDLIGGTGHRAVVAADQPGFLVNHAGRGLYTEGLRLLEEQVASVAEIDTVLREAAGFRMGPFELLDLTGLDVSSKVMRSIYEQFNQEPRFRPSALVPPRVAAGLFGRKTGQGWYVYDGDVPRRPPARERPALPDGLSVWIEPQASGLLALRAVAAAAGVPVLDDPQAAALLLLQPWGQDATRHAVALGLDAARCVAVDPLPPLHKHRTLMLTVTTSPAARDAALALFTADGTAATVINDSPGFITQRVLATVVNIAANIVQMGIASIADLEDAVRLGLGYPQGPLAWGDQIGPARVLETLQGLQAATGDPRYRASPWLARRVALGLSLRTPEAPR